MILLEYDISMFNQLHILDRNVWAYALKNGSYQIKMLWRVSFIQRFKI